MLQISILLATNFKINLPNDVETNIVQNNIQHLEYDKVKYHKSNVLEKTVKISKNQTKCTNKLNVSYFFCI